MFKPSKCDFTEIDTDFKHSLVVGPSVSEIADLLGSSHTTIYSLQRMIQERENLQSAAFLWARIPF